MPRLPAALAVVAAVLVSILVVTGPLGAQVPDPTPWPTTPGADPDIEATAHALRVAGPDRFQTSLTAALLLRGDGGYPFTSPDRTAGSAGLGETSQWWGLGTCPFAVIVAAGDIPADALAASALSDPTDGSSEPVLTRSAAADPFFDPVGATAHVDTEGAPIVLTASARDGATGLTASARTAVFDLAAGGCTSVRAAIVVGGPAAVPAAVDQELVDLGLDEVFRVSGTSRFDTAANIARALGTGEAVDAACLDADVTDGDTRAGFYGNAAVEYRTSPVDCAVLPRTVVVTDGITGADALAAGWWTSRWQVPILLVGGDGTLPEATRAALADLAIDNVIVLGGQARIPEATAAEISATATAHVVRVAGADRYATSVAMAGAFAGWFPTDDGADHDGSLVCLAASSGSGSGSVGWPDALGAGPWCAAAATTPAPVRGLAPVAGAVPRVTRGEMPSKDLVPVLLTPAGGELPKSVADLLALTFDPGDTWCSGVQADEGCLDPGFVVAFGGRALVPDDALVAASKAVSGQTYVVLDDLAPAADGAFWTTLAMGPVHAGAGATTVDTEGRVCLRRGGATGARWLTAHADDTPPTFLGAHDLLLLERYRLDRDDVARSPGTLAPVCLRVDDIASDTVVAQVVSISGHVARAGTFEVGEEHRLELSGPIEQVGAESFEGRDTIADGDDGSTSRIVFTDGDVFDVAVTSQGQPAALTGAGIDLTIRRGTTATEPDTFVAQFGLSTSLGSVVGMAGGEARRVGGRWELRGVTTLSGGTWNVASGRGGFTATLDPVSTDATDDVLTWQVDGLVDPAS